MAHRLEHRPVRGARNAAGRRVRALSRASFLAALIALGAPAARAQAPPAGALELARAGLPDIASWWSEPGRPGWTPDAWLGTAFPPVLAGLVIGGWTAVEPGRTPALPWPGLVAARSPVAWFDTLSIEPVEGGWSGFGAALVEARASSSPRGHRTRAAFALVSGSPSTDETILTVSRGDSLSGIEVGNLSGRSGASGSLDASGRHVWGGTGRLTRGRHRIEGSFAQRGVAMRLHSGEEQSGAGESGHLAWRRQSGERWLGVSVERGHDSHVSFGDGLAFSRRDAQQTGFEVEAGRSRARDGIETRFEWSRLQVSRTRFGAFELTSAQWWGAARGWVPIGGGRLSVSLGGGRNESVGLLELAPSMAYAFDWGRLSSRVAVERSLDPVVSDLASGVVPFLERTWSASARSEWAGAGPLNGGFAIVGGRTEDRARVSRLPFEELWLRAGIQRDLEPYDFVLGSAHARWTHGRFGAGGEGFVLSRSDRSPQPAVDPGTGGRFFVEHRFQAFAGDLDVAMRGLVEAVGSRESETFPSRTLAAYVSLGAAIEVGLADAIITLRARNLEDRRREQTWLDRSTGLPALGPGREIRFVLTWRLFN